MINSYLLTQFCQSSAIHIPLGASVESVVVVLSVVASRSGLNVAFDVRSSGLRRIGRFVV